MMEFVFLIFSLLSSSSVTLIAHSDTTTTRDNDWNDVVLATVGEPVTLTCVDWSVRGTVKINWMVKSPGVDQWKLVLSANERKEFSGGSSKTSMRLADPNFADTGNFSLHFVPQMQDVGRYSCLIQGQKKTLKQRIILLAVLTVTATPSNPVPQHSILRLIMEAYPVFAVSTVTWQSPGGSPLRTETVAASRAVVAKLPQVNTVDNGVYVCVVRPRGNSSTPVFRFPVDVTMDASKVYSFTDIKHAEQISTACLSQSAFPLPCPPIQGDYVLVYWQPPDTRRAMDMKLLFLYDRWRGRTEQEKPQLQLAGPLEGGGFSFRLTPGGVKDGGLYCCEVFSNDNVFSQRTMLSVLKVTATNSSTSLVLRCQYSVLSQVKKAGWSHRDPNHRLLSSSSYPGSLSTTVPLPANENSSGDYTCTLQLKNGQTFRASYTVTLSPKDSNSVSRPSLLPSLSALLLLVPLVAAVAIVLLWRQGQITRRRGIEQSLSHYSGEVENIYENPEDIRQSSPQGSVYMDLKPIEEIEVYKELNRYDQCH